MNIELIGAVFGAYLLGAIPFGLVFSRLISRRDPRQHGSGNIGATNAMRTGGKLVGVLTLLADMLKSLLPVSLAMAAGLPDLWIGAIALAAFVGHLYPVYLNFKGGKGVATMLGAMVPWQPLASLFGVLIWIVMLFAFRYVSLASVVAGAALPLLVLYTGGSMPALAISTIFALLVALKHASNLIRLKAGTEPKIGSKQKAQSDG